jgi:hypothetical protein
MKMRTRIVAAAGALAVAVGVGYGVGVAQAYQPHMQNALGDLQAAKSELEMASPNKGGHRVTAINLINGAIGEVEQGIAAGGGY